MFSSLVLNSLKCQSNGSDSDGKREKSKEEDEKNEDDSNHMYEKLPSNDGRPCKCHLKGAKVVAAKSAKTSFTKRISRWRMECPGISNFRSPRATNDNIGDADFYSNYQNYNDSKMNYEKTDGSGISDVKDLGFEKAKIIRTKVMTVNVEKIEGNLGITLRGGSNRNTDFSNPVVITYVKPDGPISRLGTIQPGDRLLAVDGVSLEGGTLNDAQRLLKQPSVMTLLTLEYNVKVMDAIEFCSGPLLVEIEKLSRQLLGLTLFQNLDSSITIQRIKPGSLADRSGALHVGDEILAINSTQVKGTSITLESVTKVLESEHPIVRLEILPAQIEMSSSKPVRKTKDTMDSTSFSTNTIKGTLNRKARDSPKNSESENDPKYISLTSLGIRGSEIAHTHSETLHITLTQENGTFGLRFVDAPDGTILINSVTRDSPAERCQCLHPGDRLLSINGRSVQLDNLNAININDLLDKTSKDQTFQSKVNLHTEFDVLDTVVPSSGIFIVKLVKRGTAGLGITMTASKSCGFIISEMKSGSIAHRAGSLMPGDKLLAINNIPLDHCSVEYAAHIFHQSTNIITLKVQRDECASDFRNRHKNITYTVDLQRYGGPLGITIAGSEEPSHPITVSGLTIGGLAEQTGVIQVGDEILAINNHPLDKEPLSKAHMLLQNSSDLVTLKLSRPLFSACKLPDNLSPVFPSSIDSAVESWDSSHIDLASSPDHQKLLKDSNDCEKRNSNAPNQWHLQSINQILTPIENAKVLECESESSRSTDDRGEQSDLSILDEITTENLKIKRELDLLSLKLDEQMNLKWNTSKSSEITQTKNDSLENSFHSTKSRLDVSNLTPINDVDTNDEGVCNLEQKSVDHVEVDKNLENRESIATTDFENFKMTYLPETRNWCTNHCAGREDAQFFLRSELQSAQLYEVTLYKDPVYEDFGFSVSDGLYERGVFINRIRKCGPADLSNILKPYDRILKVNGTSTQDFDCCLTVPLIASAGDSLVLLVARHLSATFEPQQACLERDKCQGKITLTSTNQLDNRNYNDIRRILV